MLIYNVFGRYLGVKRVDDCWLVFRADLTEKKFSRLYDIVIPDNITEDEILGWLDDIFHEAATDRHHNIKRVE